MKSILIAVLIASCALIQISCKYDGKPTTAEPTAQTPATSTS
ncbi:hypothetical protein [Aquirhabdus parva]|nr:hypothetical protein [Aquirhabdus parva]